MSVATQDGKVHGADKSLCVFDGDADNDNNDTGGDNSLLLLTRPQLLKPLSAWYVHLQEG